MKINRTMILIAAIALAGCATAPRTNCLSIGINKQKVIAIMGRPSNTAADTNGIVVLRYELTATWHAAFHHRTDDYFVRLIDGKVDCYGKIGDFYSENELTRKLSFNPK